MLKRKIWKGRNVSLFFLFLLLFSLGLNVYVFFFPLTKKVSRNTKEIATVARVIDGDTFDIAAGERIRLYEIDAPEFPAGCMGTDAKSRLESHISGHKSTSEVSFNPIYQSTYKLL